MTWRVSWQTVLHLEIMVLTFHRAPENLGLHFC